MSAAVAHAVLLVVRPRTHPYVLGLAVFALFAVGWALAITHFQVRGAGRPIAWISGHLLVILLFWVLLFAFCFSGGVLLAGLALGMFHHGAN